MKWNRENGTLSLEPQDMQVVAQCNMPLTELLRGKSANKSIPPLWSVLSYTMLQASANPSNTWKFHRHLQEMAADTRRWYYPASILKANGSPRQLWVPSHTLRYQQSFILDTILQGLPVSCHAYAYCKGRSVAGCAKPHEGQAVLIHLDIRNFFGSITEDMVFDTLRRETGYPDSLCRFFARICCLRGRLPQGTATSPMLSNIVFRPCDEALATLASAHDLRYTRYSDDLFFSGNENADANAFLRAAKQLLLSYGFRLNPEKSTVRRRKHRQAVLGLTVNDHVQVTREYRRKLAQELYYLEKFGPNCQGAILAGDYLRYMQQLQGRLAYALHICPSDEALQTAQTKLLRRLNLYLRQ